MKSLLLLTVSLCLFQISQAQTGILQKMQELPDQFNKTFKSGKKGLTIIFIPGSNDPFGRVYDKHKGEKLSDQVQFIGGFKEMMVGMDKKKKLEHLQEAFTVRYGKDHFPILIDLDSEMARMLSLEGYSIIQLEKGNEKVKKISQFDFDRVKFFNALKPYFKQ